MWLQIQAQILKTKKWIEQKKFRRPKIIFWSLAVLLVLLLAIVSQSIYDHDDFSYPLNFMVGFVKSHLATNETQKAEVNLNFTHQLLLDFDRIQKKNYNDNRLVGLAKELGAEEHLAIAHMDQAKKLGQLKRDQVHTLCEMLEQQQGIFALEVLKSPPSMRPVLEAALNVTDKEVEDAMGW